MMKAIHTLIAVAGLVCLEGCGSLASNQTGVGLFRAVVPSGLMSGLSGAETADSAVAGQESTEFGLTRAEIEEENGELLLVGIIDRGAAAFVSLTSENAGRTTWFSPDGLSVVFQNGMLIGTRGLGDDLMGLEASRSRNLLRSGGNSTRTYYWMTGLGQVEPHQFSCEISLGAAERIEIIERFYQTTRVDETCTGEDFSFRNIYWLDATGTIWQSSQLVSPGVGFLTHQKL